MLAVNVVTVTDRAVSQIRRLTVSVVTVTDRAVSQRRSVDC